MKEPFSRFDSLAYRSRSGLTHPTLARRANEEIAHIPRWRFGLVSLLPGERYR